jgi:hypothetical protein
MSATQPAAELPDDVSWEVGPDPEHSGRWYAALHWDDPVRKMHQTIRVVNEPTDLGAIRYAVDEYFHTVEHPELHFTGE